MRHNVSKYKVIKFHNKGYSKMVTDDVMAKLSQMHGVSIEGLTHQKLVRMVDEWDSIFDQALKDLDEIIHLANIKTAIEQYGVTPVIHDTNKDYLWNTYEIDLDPFVNSSNEQLSYCIESISTTITDLLLRIKRVILRVMEWFTTDSVFRTYVSSIQYYKIRMVELHGKTNNTSEQNFAKTVISGYDYQTYKRLVNAATVMTDSLSRISVPKDISELCDSTMNQLNEQFKKCGYMVAPNGTIHPTETIFYRRDVARNMEWTKTKVGQVYKDVLDLVTKGINTQKLRYALSKSVIEWEQKINDLLKQDTVDKKVIDQANMMKAGTLLLQRLTKMMMYQTSALASQWCQMVKI